MEDFVTVLVVVGIILFLFAAVVLCTHCTLRLIPKHNESERDDLHAPLDPKCVSALFWIFGFDEVESSVCAIRERYLTVNVVNYVVVSSNVHRLEAALRYLNRGRKGGVNGGKRNVE